MTRAAWATLEVFPDLARNSRAQLERQSRGPLSQAGTTGGRQYGDAAGRSAGSSFRQRFQAGLKGIAGPVTAAFAGLGVKKVLTDSVKAFTDLNLQAVQFRRLTGGSVEDASRLRTAVQLSGVDITKATTSLTLFSKNLGKAAGDAEKTAKLNGQLGTSFVNADGSIRSLTELLPEVADKFASMEDGVAKTTLATTLFGRSGTAMLPFLNKGAAGIAKLAAESDKLGLTLSEADLESFGEYRAASRELQASLQGLKVELGREVLPALTSLTKFATDEGVPALKGLGNGVRDVYGVYKSLPGPVQDAAKAFLLLRTASAIGLGTAAAGGVARLASGFTTLRLQAMFAGDAFRSASASSGTLAGGLAALRVGGTAAATALRAASLAVLPIAAVTAAITVYSQFRQTQEEAKARVDALTASLDKQTGALTADTREAVSNALAGDGGKSGFSSVQAAKDLAIGLDVLTDAALGNADAMKVVNDRLANTDGSLAQEFAADKLRESLHQQTAELDQSRQAAADYREMMRQTADATDGATTSIEDYTSGINTARTALRKLIVAEKDRKDDLLKNRRDALALDIQVANARQEAREGPAGLNTRTRAGQANRGALYDLAEQFNNSSPKVRNAEGAYARIRTEFVRLADQMGAGAGQATRLADELLRVPRTAPLKFQSEGFREVMQEVRTAKRELEDLVRIQQEGRLAVDPANPGLRPGRGGERPIVNPEGSARGTGNGATVYQFNGPVTYTDDEQGRRRARNMDRRAAGDGVRRGS